MSYLYDAQSVCITNLPRAYNDTKVSVLKTPPNEPSMFETGTNDSQQVSQYDSSDDNTRLTLLLNSPVSKNLIIINFFDMSCYRHPLDNRQQSSSK
jgi:hypothetical protein